jgi:hypothetical protein
MFQTILVARLIFILGILNLITGAAILFSCRCIPGAKIMGKLTKYRAYQKFSKYHCYIWCIFWPSVFLHATLAIAFFGIPF